MTTVHNVPTIRKRSHRPIVIVSALIALGSFEARRPTRTHVVRTWLDFWEHTEFMADAEFKQCYCLSREGFKELLQVLRPVWIDYQPQTCRRRDADMPSKK